MPDHPKVVPMSIVLFHTAQHRLGPDELFLLYSKGFEHGPGIVRDGIGEPHMTDPRDPHRTWVTLPSAQRRGTWLIDGTHARQLEETILASDAAGSPPKITQPEADKWIAELAQTPDYITEFSNYYPQYDITGMQGCGNTTMNDWFVAYLRSPFTKDVPILLHVPRERFDDRTYTCLTKWRDMSPDTQRRYTIENLRLNQYQTRVHQNNEDITDKIEFALFGQKLVDEGKITDFGSIAEQFADIRHLFRLPNINPDKDFGAKWTRDDGTVIDIIQPRRPRILFNQPRYYDVWFGEQQMIDPRNIDLLNHALTEPVILNTDFMGGDEGLLDAAFSEAGYRRIPDDRSAPRERGFWRWYSRPHRVQIYLQRNVYAYTMLGLTKEGDIVASAAGGRAGRIGQTLEGMAQNMISSGCREVILIDEGNDVFQWAQAEYKVLPERGRVRAVLVFGKRR